MALLVRTFAVAIVTAAVSAIGVLSSAAVVAEDVAAREPSGAVSPADESVAPALADGLPSDSVFLLHWKSREKGGFASTHLSRVRRALGRSGFLDRFLEEYQSTLSADDRRGFESQAKRWRKILDEVPWWPLVSREVAIGARVGVAGRLELLALFRTGRTVRDETLEALRNVLYAIAGVGDNLELEVGSRDDDSGDNISTAVLYNRIDYGEQVCISGWRDVVAVSTSATYLRKTLHVLEGRGRDIGLIHAPVFRDSATALASRASTKRSVADSTGSLEIWLNARAVFGGFELLDVLDSYHLEAHATGDVIHSQSMWSLTDRSTSPLQKALTAQADARDLAARVPASAVAFGVAAGADPAKLYEACLEFLVLMSGDPEFGEEIERELAFERFHLARDVLQNLTGRRVVLEFAGPSPEAGKPPAPVAQAWLLELRDASRARDVLAKLVEDVRKPLGRWNITIERSTEDGIVSFRLPLLDASAYLAIVDSFAVFATSRAALDTVSAGAAARKIDWLPESGELDSFSEGPWSASVQSASWVLRMSGLVGTLLSDDGGPGFLKPLLVAAPKLLPVVSSLDFLGESRCFTSREGRAFYSSGRTTIHSIRDF